MKTATGICLIIMLAAGLAACDFFDDSRGPYLQSPTPSSVLVKWRSNKAVQSRVRYGTESGQLDQVAQRGSDSRDHEVLLEGLKPATGYYYQVNGLEDETFRFTTAPPVGDTSPVRVWILGDSGSGDERAEKVRDAFYRFNEGPGADLMLLLGDNAYDVGSDAEYQKAFFDMYPESLATTPVYPTLGNHDTETELGAPYFEIFSLPVDGGSGGVASGTESYYSFDFANIHFVTLDTEISDRSPGSEMYRWLVADLQANKQDWTILFMHHPFYSKGRHDSDAAGTAMTDLRQHYTPIFETYGVDLVFSGHNHNYERSFPLLGHRGTADTWSPSMRTDPGNGRVDGDGAYRKDGIDDGVIYVVAGSGSKAHRYPVNHPANYYSVVELGSMVLDFEGQKLTATFVSANPQAVDYFTIIKDGN